MEKNYTKQSTYKLWHFFFFHIMIKSVATRLIFSIYAKGIGAGYFGTGIMNIKFIIFIVLEFWWFFFIVRNHIFHFSYFWGEKKNRLLLSLNIKNIKKKKIINVFLQIHRSINFALGTICIASRYNFFFFGMNKFMILGYMLSQKLFSQFFYVLFFLARYKKWW